MKKLIVLSVLLLVPLSMVACSQKGEVPQATSKIIFEVSLVGASSIGYGVCANVVSKGNDPKPDYVIEQLRLVPDQEIVVQGAIEPLRLVYRGWRSGPGTPESGAPIDWRFDSRQKVNLWQRFTIKRR